GDDEAPTCALSCGSLTATSLMSGGLTTRREHAIFDTVFARDLHLGEDFDGYSTGPSPRLRLRRNRKMATAATIPPAPAARTSKSLLIPPIRTETSADRGPSPNPFTALT